MTGYKLDKIPYYGEGIEAGAINLNTFDSNHIVKEAYIIKEFNHITNLIKNGVC